MKPDFDSPVVLANTARVLRSEVLPTVEDEGARLALIRVIAVIEAHLVQLAAEDPDTTDAAAERTALMAHDGPLLLAFGGRLRGDQDDRRNGST